MNFVFLDTNIFIHFQDFDSIDWKNVLNKNEDYEIVLAPSVLSELDSHKYHKNSKISRRVKRILPKIEKYILNKEFPISISIKPKEETFNTNSLDRIDQDDNILAAILEFKKTISEQDSVIFISHDTGPRLKAITLSINTSDLNNKYFIENEPDENELKNKELEKELKKFKNLSPDVKLLFYDKKEYLKVATKEKLEDRLFYINSRLKKIKNEYPYLIEDHSKSTVFKLSKSQIDDYNKELEKFFSKHEQRIESIYDGIKYLNECIKINLSLFNNGNFPAQDIDVSLHFPDGFLLHTKEELPQILVKPKEPYKPKHFLDQGRISNTFLHNHFEPTYSSKNIIINTNGIPKIKKTNSYNVDFHIDNLKHNQKFDLESLFLKYDDKDLAENFSIDYEIMVANYPEKIVGKLNVIIK